MWDQRTIGTNTHFLSRVYVLFLTMAVSTGRGPPTSADAEDSSSSETNVLTQSVKSGLQDTSTSHGVVTRVDSGGEAIQGNSVSTGPERSQSLVVFNQTETVKSLSSSFSKGSMSVYNMNTPNKLTTVPLSTIPVDMVSSPYLFGLPFVKVSDNVGYVTSPGFDDNQKYPNNFKGSYHLNVLYNESVVINFVSYCFQCEKFYESDYLGLRMMTRKIYGKIRCCKHNIKTFVLQESVELLFITDSSVRGLGFKMMFAILPRSQEPQKLPSKLLNCSVPNFHRFSLVLSCNLLTECEGGEDEQNCGHRNNECGMEDTIDIGTKCYSLVLHQRDMTWFDAYKGCIKRGQKLATLEDPADFRQFKAYMPPVVDLVGYFVGGWLRDRLQAVSITALYRNIWQWVDGRTVFSVQISDDYYMNEGSCVMYDPWLFKVISVSCHETKRVSAFVCEFDKHNAGLKNVTLDDVGSDIYVDATKIIWHMKVIQCPSDHVTRDFLSCDFQTDCDTSYSVTSCSTGNVTVPMFLCQRSRASVHYTLVCDHIQHCSDNSDEGFCKHPKCLSNSLKCQNGQCIHRNQLCDGKLDCYDGSDEVCSSKRYSSKTTSPPGSVHLDGRGNFWLDRMDDSGDCPPTHFLCRRVFCLPVYLRCNGIDDCLDREDEVGCDNYRCRGFYRCRGSKVCLHADSVCDGVPQCPEQDDEMLCDLTCPEQCHCQGLAFVCTSNFSVASYIFLRYLDVSGSNMTISDVLDNIYLIVLRLSNCHINNLPLGMSFPNLKEFDISWNVLYRLDMQHFYPLKNLKVLVLAGNPLVKITNSELSRSVTTTLESVDLSHTRLEEFGGNELANSPNIKILNISWSKLRSIAEDCFQVTSELEILDLRGFHLSVIPKHLLKGLIFLKNVHAENYKFCCEAMLPVNFDLKNCHTRRDLLSSCDDLLKSSIYRICLWIFVSLSLVGNMFSVGARLYQQQEGGALGSFGVFVINLSVADLFMGVYLAIIGTADFVYRGRYLWLDDEWKKSAACNIAGFLCLLSSETSAFIICLITLDRFLVLRFPFGRLHFRRRSALAACGVVWAVGISLSTIPLLPLTSHWEFYSQTGICIPLPFTISKIFYGYDYSFGVSILLNLVLFLVIAVGQAFVYWAVRSNSMPSSTNTQTRDAAVARRLITVVVSDFLCWFPIGFLGLLAFTGTPIPGDLNVAVATFVLPVNSALNPFLYTFNLFMEKRRKAQHKKLLKRLQLERQDQTTITKDKTRKAPESDKAVIIQQIKAWVDERVLSIDELLSCSLPVADTRLS